MFRKYIFSWIASILLHWISELKYWNNMSLIILIVKTNFKKQTGIQYVPMSHLCTFILSSLALQIYKMFQYTCKYNSLASLAGNNQAQMYACMVVHPIKLFHRITVFSGRIWLFISEDNIFWPYLSIYFIG